MRLQYIFVMVHMGFIHNKERKTIMIAGVSIWGFLLLQLVIAVGCYVQITTGFALGLIVVGVVVLFDIMPLPPLAIAMGFVMLANGSVALWSGRKSVQKKPFIYILIAFLPALAIGVIVLHRYYDSDGVYIIKIVLGLVIILSSLLLIVKPPKNTQQSLSIEFIATGALGGIMGGLFTTPGPPLVFTMFRQPWHIDSIRNTLIAVFMIGSIGRIFTVIYDYGYFPIAEFLLGIYSFPTVVISSKIAQWHSAYIPTPLIKKIAFIILFISGWILIF